MAYARQQQRQGMSPGRKLILGGAALLGGSMAWGHLRRGAILKAIGKSTLQGNIGYFQRRRMMKDLAAKYGDKHMAAVMRKFGG